MLPEQELVEALARIETLEAELVRSQQLRDSYMEQILTLEAQVAKLNAVVDAAKKAASQHGIVYPIPSSGEWAMTELKQALAALEEVKDG